MIAIKNKIIKILSLVSILILLASNISVYGICIHSAKSRSQLAQENLTTVLLPSFRYDRNNIELNQKSGVDLILNLNAKIVTVEVTQAEGIGLGIDDAILLKDGLKILRPRRLRSNNQDPIKENKETKLLKSKVVTFNLTNPGTQHLIIDAVDFKVLKVFVNGLLPGLYTLKATIDKQRTTTTLVFTKPDFRLDAISPSIINRGIETTLTLIGKGLDSLTEVFLGDSNIEVRETESLDDGTIKVKAFATEDTSPGFRDVTISNPLTNMSVTLVNGLYISGPTIGTDELNDILSNIMDGMDGAPGMDGANGIGGKDGKNICDNFDAMLMIFTNNLPPGSQANVFFDPVLCNLTFGIPVGFNGVNGSNGSDGSDGMGLCNNMNATPTTVVNSLPAGSMATVTLDPVACTITYGIPQGDTGATGSTGLAGINCWDLDGDRVNDSNEDINMDGAYNTLDCQGPELRTIEEVITNWSTLSDEQDYTTASGDMSRMVKIPFFIHDGIVYGGFWVDKYEAAKADATSTAEGTSSIPVSKRNVVPWTGINLTTAKTNASASGRQISGLGSCKLIGMREWYALYLLGRHAKVTGYFGATAISGWNERGNTRSGKDGRNSSSFTCSDDPIENGGGAGRCLTGTGYKSWGHLLDGTADKNPDSSSLGTTADSATNSTSAFDGDKQIYDLTGNVKEWIDFTVTRASSNTKVDSGYQAAGVTLPFTTNKKYFSFDDIAGNTNTSTSSDEIEFRGLGLPRKGADGLQTDTNGGINDGKLFTSSTNQQYGTVRGGAFNNASGDDSRSPLFLDISSTPTTTETSRGFRVICDFSNP